MFSKRSMMSDPDQHQMAHSLHRAGYRLTQPRLAILQVLQDNNEGLNPEEVYRQSKAICPSLGLVTVYRTLDLLAELGLVRRVHSEQRCHSYAASGDERHYLICQACHRVIEFPCDGLESLIDGIRQKTGYTITDHLLELSGLCPDCQSGQNVGESPRAHTTCVRR
jgi:Fur family ferric uptake transcriptional regulator